MAIKRLAARAAATTVALSFALVALAASPAGARDVPFRSFFVGLHAGPHFVLDDWDLHKRADAGVSPDSSAIFGLRLGYEANTWLGFQLGVSLLPYGDASGHGTALNYAVDVEAHPWDWAIQPYLGLGAGAYHNVGGAFGADIDYELHWQLGLRAMVSESTAFRLEARHLMTDAWGASAPASNLAVTLGVDLFAWKQDHTPPDADKDGVPDGQDACPSEAGPRATKGCPDGDADGIADRADKCPVTPGVAAHSGCPDTDGDGIVDRDDRCPKVPGVPSEAGCPEPPKDRDKDGVVDDKDRCPDTPGLVDFKGCPDTDGDGIPDVEDKCPKLPGVPAEQGCLPEEVKKFSGAIEGIYFASGSSKIRKKSFKVLDAAAAVLKKWPTVHLRIEGHTDNRGKASANKKLSQARAEAVRDYMISKGLDASRLTAVGYGPDRPVASNKTSKGRAKNRRIEFVVVK